MAKPEPVDPALERLRSTPITEVAAILFVEAFRPGVKMPRSFRDIHRDLAALSGLSKPGILGGRQRDDYAIALECTILWERALLAARMWVGESTSLHLVPLRRGEEVRTSGHPIGAARAALADMEPPPIRG